MKQIRGFGRWTVNQADAFVRGLMRLATTHPKAWLPAGIWSTLMWVVRSASWSLGSSTPVRQITSSFALLLFALLTSWITLGATLVLAAFFVVTMSVGFLRLFPVVDGGFVDVRDALIP